jgi:hypothetical protein
MKSFLLLRDNMLKRTLDINVQRLTNEGLVIRRGRVAVVPYSASAPFRRRNVNQFTSVCRELS